MSERGNFDHPVLQNHIAHLRADGFVVHTDYFLTPEETSEALHAALVVGDEEYYKTLATYNEARRDAWLGQQSVNGLMDGQAAEFQPFDEWPQDLRSRDPRYVTSETAWDALSQAEELAARLADGAADEEYIELDTPLAVWSGGEIETIDDRQIDVVGQY